MSIREIHEKLLQLEQKIQEIDENKIKDVTFYLLYHEYIQTRDLYYEMICALFISKKIPKIVFPTF